MKISRASMIVVMMAVIIISGRCYGQFLKLGTTWAMNIEVEVETTLVDTYEIKILENTTKSGVVYQLDTVVVKSARIDTISVDTTRPFIFAPSIGFDVFTRESKSGNYKIGIIPGVGYGIKIKPRGWKHTKYLIGLDLFLQGLLTEEMESHDGFDYFNIDVLPVLNVIDWFGIGYGLRYKVGLEGVPSESRWIFSFGIRKATS